MRAKIFDLFKVQINTKPDNIIGIKNIFFLKKVTNAKENTKHWKRKMGNVFLEEKNDSIPLAYESNLNEKNKMYFLNSVIKLKIIAIKVNIISTKNGIQAVFDSPTTLGNIVNKQRKVTKYNSELPK